MSIAVDLPRVNMAFVSPQTGMLTEYGRALLNGLRSRTGGDSGVDITKLQTYINQQFQNDRESPLPEDFASSFASKNSDESPTPTPNTMQAEDVGIAGLVFALMARLHTAEKRITALENHP